MAKTLTMVAYRRPDYTRQVLEALASCEGIEEYLLVVSIDYSNMQQSVLDEFRKYPHRVEIYVQDENLGCAGNTGWTLKRGFERVRSEGQTFLIHLEDDTMPSKGFLRYMEWAAEEYAEDKDIFSVSGYRHRSFRKPDNPYYFEGYGNEGHVYRQHRFTCWGWGTWLDRWETIEQSEQEWFGIRFHEWPDEADKFGSNFLTQENFMDKTYMDIKGSWAYPMGYYWMGKRNEIVPDVSRIQNIGREEGEFATVGSWLALQHTPIWMGDDIYRDAVINIFEEVIN